MSADPKPDFITTDRALRTAASIQRMITSPATILTIAANVRGELARQQLSQAALAAAMGLNSQQQLSRRMTGTIRWQPTELELLIDELGVTFGSLLDRHLK